MDKNKLPLRFPKIPMVVVFDETVLEPLNQKCSSSQNGKKLGMVFVLQNTALRVSRSSRVNPPPPSNSSKKLRRETESPHRTDTNILFTAVQSIHQSSIQIFATKFNTRFSSQLTS